MGIQHVNYYYYDENMVMILLLPHCRQLEMMLMMMISQACPCEAPISVELLFYGEAPNRSNTGGFRCLFGYMSWLHIIGRTCSHLLGSTLIVQLQTYKLIRNNNLR